MTRFQLPLLLVLVLASSGCFQSTTLIRVSADGSGTIEQTTVLTTGALGQLRLFAPPGSDGQPFNPFSEEQERAAISQLGPGVTLVSSTPVHETTGDGRRSVYAFADINQLHIDQRPAMPGGLGLPAQGINTDPLNNIRFVLTHEPGDTARLSISFPRPHVGNQTAPPDDTTPVPNRLPNQPAEGQLAMLKQLLRGMKVAVAVQPVGTLIHTNTPYTDGQTVTLLDLDFDQLINDSQLVTRLQGARTIEDAKAVLSDVPGMKVNLNGDIIIEFTPAR